MDQRVQFIADYQRDESNVAELARRYGISRKTAYKWVERYQVDGPRGLLDRSRRPTHAPNTVAAPIVEAFIEVRRHHPTWGAKKLLKVVGTRHASWEMPARSTVCTLLGRAGLITTSRRRTTPAHPERPLLPMTAPNGTWTADFKGQFKTRDAVYCYPLTVVDGFSRYLLGCQGVLSTAIEVARPIFLRLFHEYGLPSVMRTDNGVPFATTALGRLSTLSVWWIRLGILPELIAPGSPQQNGRHERMHRTLKGRGDAPTQWQPGGAAAALQSLSPGIQLRPASRGAPSRDTGLAVHAVVEEAPRETPAPGVPGPLRNAPGEPQQWDPLEEAVGLRDAHARRRVRRARRSRGWALGRILRTGHARTDG